jgi:addiction module RelB/DinJ family antitoxin
MNTVISVRINKQVKASAQEVAESIGIKLGTLINSYLRQIVATRRIELYAPEKMSPKLEGLISEVETELQSGMVSKKFTDEDSFLKDLKQ